MLGRPVQDVQGLRQGEGTGPRHHVLRRRVLLDQLQGEENRAVLSPAPSHGGSFRPPPFQVALSAPLCGSPPSGHPASRRRYSSALAIWRRCHPPPTGALSASVQVSGLSLFGEGSPRQQLPDHRSCSEPEPPPTTTTSFRTSVRVENRERSELGWGWGRPGGTSGGNPQPTHHNNERKLG